MGFNCGIVGLPTLPVIIPVVTQVVLPAVTQVALPAVIQVALPAVIQVVVLPVVIQVVVLPVVIQVVVLPVVIQVALPTEILLSNHTVQAYDIYRKVSTGPATGSFFQMHDNKKTAGTKCFRSFYYT